MVPKYLLFALLFISISSHLTSELGLPEQTAAILRTNVLKAHDSLEGFGQGSASLSIIKLYLSKINQCLDDVLNAYKSSHNNAGITVNDDDIFVIGNK